MYESNTTICKCNQQKIKYQYSLKGIHKNKSISLYKDKYVSHTYSLHVYVCVWEDEFGGCICCRGKNRFVKIFLRKNKNKKGVGVGEIGDWRLEIGEVL